MEKQSIVQRAIHDAINLKMDLLNDPGMMETISEVAEIIVACFKKEGKVLFCGNGGSAADSQHLAAELSGRYYYDRPPLAAEALHVNTSYLTAVANDYSFDEVYARLTKAMGKSGDILIGMSTSGNSPNVLNALKQARDSGMKAVAFTGEGGGAMKDHCDYLIAVPSKDTPRIQECHMLIGHIICEMVEKTLFPE